LIASATTAAAPDSDTGVCTATSAAIAATRVAAYANTGAAGRARVAAVCAGIACLSE
jgi:hypothetical protein